MRYNYEIIENGYSQLCCKLHSRQKVPMVFFKVNLMWLEFLI